MLYLPSRTKTSNVAAGDGLSRQSNAKDQWYVHLHELPVRGAVTCTCSCPYILLRFIYRCTFQSQASDKRIQHFHSTYSTLFSATCWRRLATLLNDVDWSFLWFSGLDVNNNVEFIWLRRSISFNKGVFEHLERCRIRLIEAHINHSIFFSLKKESRKRQSVSSRATILVPKSTLLALLINILHIPCPLRSREPRPFLKFTF